MVSEPFSWPCCPSPLDLPMVVVRQPHKRFHMSRFVGRRFELYVMLFVSSVMTHMHTFQSSLRAQLSVNCTGTAR